eukprot:1464920-Amphidinium_carterae.1
MACSKRSGMDGVSRSLARETLTRRSGVCDCKNERACFACSQHSKSMTFVPGMGAAAQTVEQV